MTNVIQPRVGNELASMESNKVSGSKGPGLQGLADTMDLLFKLRQALNSVYSKQRDLNRQQQTQAQSTSLNNSVSIFEDKEKSADLTLKAAHENAAAGIASGFINLAGTAIGGVAKAGSFQAGSGALGQAVGGIITNSVKYGTSGIERESATLQHSAELKQTFGGTISKTADEAQAANREASAKLAESMKAVNDMLSGFLSQPQFR